MSTELVLCAISVDLFRVLGHFTGFRPFTRHAPELDSLFAGQIQMQWVERPIAEESESWKQLIPVCVFTNQPLQLRPYFPTTAMSPPSTTVVPAQPPTYDSETRIFHYTRTKLQGENRLHGKVSIMVGGHVNPDDGMVAQVAYEAALHRELTEEVYLTAPPIVKPLGFIYDDANPVGRVHLGIVYECVVPSVKVREDKLMDFPGSHSAIALLSAHRNNVRHPGEIPSDGSVSLEPWAEIFLDYVVSHKV